MRTPLSDSKSVAVVNNLIVFLFQKWTLLLNSKIENSSKNLNQFFFSFSLVLLHFSEHVLAIFDTVFLLAVC